MRVEGISGIHGRRLQDLASHQVAPGYRGRPSWYVLLWMLVMATVFRWSPHPAYAWRALLLRAFGASIGTNVKIRSSARVFYPWRLSIGDNSWIGDFADLYSHAQITIGRDSVVSQYSYICTAGHDYTRSDFPLVAEPVTIGNEAWIAADVYVAPGVRIGSGSVIGARSTVLSDIPENVVAYGHPAKVARARP